MCGGRGTRLESEREKPLFRIDGEPMVDRVRRALAASDVDRPFAAVSPNAPETRDHLEDTGWEIVETAGAGYVSDLGDALADDRLSRPVLTVAADLPLLSGPVVDRVLDRYRTDRRTRNYLTRNQRVNGMERDPANGHPGRAGDDESGANDVPSMTVCVPVALKRRLGASVDATLAPADAHLAPTGVNVVGTADTEREMIRTSYDDRLAINVNRLEDARLAEKCLAAASLAEATEDRCD